MSRQRRIARLSNHVPILRQIRDYAYHKHFDAATGHVRLFRGVYPDFQTASNDIPKSRLASYDNEPSAQRLADDRMRIYPFDYPIMFWLSKLLPNVKLLFDWGGHVGISYFGYRGYLSYPAGLNWLICDVPAVTRLGQKIAAENSAPGLAFTTTTDLLGDADLLLAAGSLHFMEDPFQPLRAARVLPPHVLINKVPAHELASAVTLHNMGSAFCPYHLFNRKEFIDQFLTLGYRLADEWTSPDIGCEIPFHPDYSIRAYSGFYFTKHPAIMRQS